jgi:hypothetical protein
MARATRRLCCCACGYQGRVDLPVCAVVKNTQTEMWCALSFVVAEETTTSQRRAASTACMRATRIEKKHVAFEGSAVDRSTHTSLVVIDLAPSRVHRHQVSRRVEEARVKAPR